MMLAILCSWLIAMALGLAFIIIRAVLSTLPRRRRKKATWDGHDVGYTVHRYPKK